MQIVSPAFIAVGAFSAVIGYALPDIQQVIDPPPDQVHSLSVLPGPCERQAETFSGCVVQAWSIHADGVVFYVACDPVVLLGKSCIPLPGCTCELLRATHGDPKFRRLATWCWRSDQSTQLSSAFTLTE